MYAAIWRHLQGESIEAVEKGLIGTLIMAPYLRLGAVIEALKPEHFLSQNNATMFRSVMRLKRPEIALVVYDLDSHGHPIGNVGGWATLVCETLECALVDDDAVMDAATAIREAATRRASAARRARPR